MGDNDNVQNAPLSPTATINLEIEKKKKDNYLSQLQENQKLCNSPQDRTVSTLFGGSSKVLPSKTRLQDVKEFVFSHTAEAVLEPRSDSKAPLFFFYIYTKAPLLHINIIKYKSMLSLKSCLLVMQVPNGQFERQTPAMPTQIPRTHLCSVTRRYAHTVKVGPPPNCPASPSHLRSPFLTFRLITGLPKRHALRREPADWQPTSLLSLVGKYGFKDFEPWEMEL